MSIKTELVPTEKCSDLKCAGLSFDKCIDPCSQHSDQNTDPVHHPRKVPFLIPHMFYGSNTLTGLRPCENILGGGE